MKVLFRSLIGLGIILVLGIAIVLFVAKTQLPDVIASKLSSKLKVPVQIGNINLSFKSIGVQKLEIENPKPYQLPLAFSANTLTISAPLTIYLYDQIVIEEILIDNIYLGLEFESATGIEGNWSTIINNLQDTVREGASQDTKAKKTVLIRRILLTNIQTDLLYRKSGKKVKHLPVIPSIELTNISSEGSSAFDQIMDSALGEMLKQVFIKQNLKDLLNQFVKPNNALQQALKPFKGLFGLLSEQEGGVST